MESSVKKLSKSEQKYKETECTSYLDKTHIGNQLKACYKAGHKDKKGKQ